MTRYEFDSSEVFEPAEPGETGDNYDLSEVVEGETIEFIADDDDELRYFTAQAVRVDDESILLVVWHTQAVVTIHV